MERIGVTNIDFWFILDEDPLIKEFVFFDKLKFFYLGKKNLIKLCKTIPGGEDKLKEKVKEIEILQGYGLIEEYIDEYKTQDKLNAKDKKAIKLAVSDLHKFRSDFPDHKSDSDLKEFFIYYVEKFRLAGQLSSRFYAALLNETSDNHFIPVIRKSFENYDNDSIEIKKASTLSVVLNKFPILQANNPIERFIEFKKDPDTKLKLGRLNDWIIDISRKNYSIKELSEKIDYLIMEYTKQLEIYKLKHNKVRKS